KKAWQRSGALGNVRMADEALDAKHRGRSLDRVEAMKNKEMREAEKPRKSVMDDGDSFEEEKGEGMLENGRRNSAAAGRRVVVGDGDGDGDAGIDRRRHERERERGPGGREREREEDETDETMVESEAHTPTGDGGHVSFVQ
ncbi:hypothetical protein LTR28_005493, partial [Elasticomyces elasticus]